MTFFRLPCQNLSSPHGQRQNFPETAYDAKQNLSARDEALISLAHRRACMHKDIMPLPLSRNISSHVGLSKIVVGRT